MTCVQIEHVSLNVSTHFTLLFNGALFKRKNKTLERQHCHTQSHGIPIQTGTLLNHRNYSTEKCQTLVNHLPAINHFIAPEPLPSISLTLYQRLQLQSFQNCVFCGLDMFLLMFLAIVMSKSGSPNWRHSCLLSRLQ